MDKYLRKTCHLLVLTLSVCLLGYQPALAARKGNAKGSSYASRSTIWMYLDQEDKSLSSLISGLESQAREILMKQPESREAIGKRVALLEELGFRKLKKLVSVRNKPACVLMKHWDSILLFWKKVDAYKGKRPGAMGQVLGEKPTGIIHPSSVDAKYQKLHELMSGVMEFINGNAESIEKSFWSDTIPRKPTAFLPAKDILAGDIVERYIDDPTFQNSGSIFQL